MRSALCKGSCDQLRMCYEVLQGCLLYRNIVRAICTGGRRGGLIECGLHLVGQMASIPIHDMSIAFGKHRGRTPVSIPLD